MPTTTVTYKITINVAFPNGQTTQTPTVINATTQSDTIPANVTDIEWELFDDEGDNDANLTLARIEFFTDAGKTNKVTPPCFGTASNGGNRKAYIVPLNATQVSTETTYYYKVWFNDQYHTGMNWDPTVKIEPRGF